MVVYVYDCPGCRQRLDSRGITNRSELVGDPGAENLAFDEWYDYIETHKLECASVEEKETMRAKDVFTQRGLQALGLSGSEEVHLMHNLRARTPGDAITDNAHITSAECDFAGAPRWAIDLSPMSKYLRAWARRLCGGR